METHRYWREENKEDKWERRKHYKWNRVNEKT